MKALCPLLLSVLILVSCNKDKFDFNKLKDLELHPELLLPIGEISLKLSDLKIDTTFISTDPDGFITIVLQKDSLLKSHLRHVLHIPEQDTTHIAVPTGQSITSEMAIRVFNNAEIKKIYFDTLEVSWMLPSSVPQGTEISVQFPGSQHQSGNILFSMENITRAQDQFYTSTFYNGYIDLSKDNTSYNSLSFILNVVQAPPQTPIGTFIPCTFTLGKLSISGMEGYLGNLFVELPLNNSALNLRGLEKFNQGINFSSPTLTVTILNTSGLELSLNPSINGANNNNSEVTSLEVPTIYISKSQSPGQSSITHVTLNNTNSNLSDVLRKLPDNLLTSGSLTLNPSGKQFNFLRKNDEVILSGLFEIPLEFSAKDMFFETEVQNFNFWKNSTNHLPEYIEFEFNSENGFPFDLSLSAVFTDSVTHSHIKTFDIDILKPASINQDGRVIASNTFISKIKLSESDISSLGNARSFLLKVKINTPESGEKVVKIYEEYFFKTKILAKAKLRITPLR